MQITLKTTKVNMKYDGINLLTWKHKKVREHCYYTLKYWGAAHSICNLQYIEHGYIPMLAHNSEGYYNHLLFIKISEKFEKTVTFIFFFFCKMF